MMRRDMLMIMMFRKGKGVQNHSRNAHNVCCNVSQRICVLRYCSVLLNNTEEYDTKAKVEMFRAKFIFVFSSLVSIRLCIYAIYNISSLVFFNSFNDGWHEQDLNKEWNPNVSRGGVSLKFRFRAVSYLSWLGSGWVFWDPKSKTFGTQKNWEFLFPQCGISWRTQNVEFVRPKCAFDFILVPRSRGYTWSSLHKWQ